MGKKGSKRKTRWRTLSIGAPPGEEDEEEGLRNGYVKNRDADNGSVHSFDRNDQSSAGYKPRRGTLVGNSTVGSTAGGGSGGSRSRRDETPGSPSQPKIIFNEDEYTRITTPRQDVLFKKSYLSRKKPWASNASTSATPSTTESQSASHSTADGSETMEDQQLLDRDCGAGEYMAPVIEPGAQISYGTFYDHGSGYYYEYPVMLVGPAPIPAPVGPSVLAAVPCGPVPLRPIEWINPAFVPKLSGQPYCLIDYQSGHGTEGATLDEVSDFPQPPMDISNGTCNESGTGSASCSGSVAGEVTEEQRQTDETSTKNASQDEEREQDQSVEQQDQQDQQDRQDQQPSEDQRMEENGVNESGPYLEPVLVQQPVHMSHVSHVPHVPHVVSAVPQPYMYPGHYMFGPPLVNVNGVTIQGGPMIRTTDVAAMAAAYAKRRKKKKRRKQRRPALGNAEGDEEEEYSSECDNGVLSSRLSWPACPTSGTENTDSVSGSSARAQNRPLNPECQEFQLRPATDERGQSREKCASPSLLTTSDEAPNSDGTTSNPIDTLSSTIPDSVAPEGQSESNGSLSSTAGLKDTHAESSSSLSSNFGLKDTRDSNGTLSPSSERVNEPAKEEHSPTKAERRRRRRNINLDASQMNGTSTLPRSENPGEVMSNGKAEDKVHAEDGRLKEKCVLTNGQSGQFAVSKVEQNVPSEASRRESLAVEAEKAETKKNAESRRKAEAGQSAEVKQNSDSRQNSENSVGKSRRKYSSKGAKFVREPTPGPDLTDESKEATEVASEKLNPSKSEKEVNQKNVHENCEVKTSAKESEKTETEPNLKSEGINEPLVSTVAVEDTNPIVGLENSVVKDAQRAGLDSMSSETNDIEMKAVSDGIAECSTEDSGFESQTRTSDYPITEAVTEWLRKANSPEMFITSNSASDSDDEVDEDVEMEDMDKAPSKNLQGNPMPALSANGEINSSWASRGEFARSNSREQVSPEDNDRVDLEVGSREWERNARNRPDGVSRKLKRNAVCNAGLTNDRAGGALQRPNPPLDNALALTTNNIDAPTVDAGGNTCEFTGKDSTAGMRVASSSRMGLKKVEGGNGGGRRRGSRRSGKYKRDLAEVVDVKIIRRSVDDNSDDLEDTISVRTYEKGEIVVSAAEGKLLPITSYEPFLRKDLTPLSETSPDGFKVEEVVTPASAGEREKKNGRESDSLTSPTNVLTSSLHIEEPDVLECWEVETIEPVITPKKMVQSRGVSYDGEAAEEDCFEPEPENVERVQKYYRLADSVVSVEEDTDLNENSVSSLASNPFARATATLPNSPDRPVVETPVCYEETPTFSEPPGDADLGRIPVDEAFEVYESCYTAKPRIFAFDANVLKPRPLRQDGEGPIPCRAACCNIQ